MKRIRSVAAAAVVTSMAAASPVLADFNGAYLGAYAGVLGATSPPYPLVGVQGGYTFSGAATTFGIEAKFGLVSLAGTFAGDVGLAAEFGLMVGENARFYGTTGVGALVGSGSGQFIYTFGMGIEVPIGQNGFSLFFEPYGIGTFGGAPPSCCAFAAVIGFNLRR